MSSASQIFNPVPSLPRAPVSYYPRTSQSCPQNDRRGPGVGEFLIQSCRSPGDVRNPGHVGIEEIRGGAGGGGGDLLGLLLLFPLAAHVAKGAELGAPSGAEAGASAGPDELSVKRPGHCSPALRPQPPPPHPCSHCSASRCIKDLKQSHRAALLTLTPLPPFGLGAAVHAGCFLTDRAFLLMECYSVYRLPLFLTVPHQNEHPLTINDCLPPPNPSPRHTHTHHSECPVWRELNNPDLVLLPTRSPHP